MQALRPHPALLHQHLYYNKVPQESTKRREVEEALLKATSLPPMDPTFCVTLPEALEGGLFPHT
jgi:hypothetical protein